MKFAVGILALACCCGTLAGCGLIEQTVRFRKDEKTIHLSVPAVAAPECREPLLALLSAQGGVTQVTPDVPGGRLTITYNSRVVALRNLEYALTEAGFDVGDREGDPAAQAHLPAACR